MILHSLNNEEIIIEKSIKSIHVCKYVRVYMCLWHDLACACACVCVFFFIACHRLQLIDDLSYEDVKKCYRGSVSTINSHTHMETGWNLSPFHYDDYFLAMIPSHRTQFNSLLSFGNVLYCVHMGVCACVHVPCASAGVLTVIAVYALFKYVFVCSDMSPFLFFFSYLYHTSWWN